MDDTLSIEVPASLDGARVDKALATLLGISRSDSRALIERGVTVEGTEARPRDRVVAGSVIRSPRPAPAPPLEPHDVDFGILYRDDTVVVVDKPPGLVVHPGSGRVGPTLASGLLHRFPGIAGVGQENRWGLVHRLDKDTSGALLVALTQSAYDELSAELAARRVRREYVALAHRLFAMPTGTIEAPIGPDPVYPTRRAVVATGKPAVTHYEVVEQYPAGPASLLEVRLETGRTHQIRVHLASIDHPVVGDPVYAAGLESLGAPRIFLHAARIRFTHPTTGETIAVEAPLPHDLRRVLVGLDGQTGGYPDDPSTV